MSHAAKLTSNDIPQADRIERVVALVVAAADGHVSAMALGLDQRDLRYYAHAALLLGLLDQLNAVTPAGQELVASAEDQRLRRLAQAFAKTRVAQAWVSWSGASGLPDVDTATAAEFLRQSSDLAETTARRRATTLRSWWSELAPHLRGKMRTPSEPPVEPTPTLPPLDALSPGEQEHFVALAHEIAPEDVPELVQHVGLHLAAFRQAAIRNDMLPLDIAVELASGLTQLLEMYAELLPRERRLVVGAARYFVQGDDERPDLEDVLGLDDDARVFNFVVTELGRADMSVDV